MYQLLKNQWFRLGNRCVSSWIILSFLTTILIPPQAAQAQFWANPSAQSVMNLPAPGTMIPLSNAFVPPMIRGLTIHPDNPLYFDFIVDIGDNRVEEEELRTESTKLIKYFLASLTTPEDEMWVNLSPSEKERIIPGSFGQTEMGRDLLAQDYLLKQLTASLMYPEKDLGREFWEKVWKKIGNTDLSSADKEEMINTFSKVWIMPDTAQVYVRDNSVFVVESKLKVMLEDDFTVGTQHALPAGRRGVSGQDHADSQQDDLKKSMIREMIIPEIEREVNEGQTFANLRQIYNSVILATWYKQNLKKTVLGEIYADQNKTKGIVYSEDAAGQSPVQAIYNQYLEAFEKGVYNFIREDYDPATQQLIPRKYFSGGAEMTFATPIPTALQLTLDQVRTLNRDVRGIGVDFAVLAGNSNDTDRGALSENIGNQWKYLNEYGFITNLGNRIRRYIKERSALNIKKFAQQAGISSSVIGRILRADTSDISLENAIRLRNFLNISIFELVTNQKSSILFEESEWEEISDNLVTNLSMILESGYVRRIDIVKRSFMYDHQLWKIQNGHIPKLSSVIALAIGTRIPIDLLLGPPKELQLYLKDSFLQDEGVVDKNVIFDSEEQPDDELILTKDFMLDPANAEQIKQMIHRGLTYSEAAALRRLKVDENINYPRFGPIGVFEHRHSVINLILAALDTIEGFKEARLRNDRLKMGELFSTHVIHYQRRNEKNQRKGSMSSFFIEQGGLESLFTKVRPSLGGMGTLAMLKLVGLEDILNLDKLKIIAMQEESDGVSAQLVGQDIADRATLDEQKIILIRMAEKLKSEIDNKPILRRVKLENGTSLFIGPRLLRENGNPYVRFLFNDSLYEIDLKQLKIIIVRKQKKGAETYSDDLTLEEVRPGICQLKFKAKTLSEINLENPLETDLPGEILRWADQSDKDSQNIEFGIRDDDEVWKNSDNNHELFHSRIEFRENGMSLIVESVQFDNLYNKGNYQLDLTGLGILTNILSYVYQETDETFSVESSLVRNEQSVRIIRKRWRELIRKYGYQHLLPDSFEQTRLPLNLANQELSDEEFEELKKELEKVLPETPIGKSRIKSGFGDLHFIVETSFPTIRIGASKQKATIENKFRSKEEIQKYLETLLKNDQLMYQRTLRLIAAATSKNWAGIMARSDGNESYFGNPRDVFNMYKILSFEEIIWPLLFSDRETFVKFLPVALSLWRLDEKPVTVTWSEMDQLVSFGLERVDGFLTVIARDFTDYYGNSIKSDNNDLSIFLPGKLFQEADADYDRWLDQQQLIQQYPQLKDVLYSMLSFRLQPIRDNLRKLMNQKDHVGKGQVTLTDKGIMDKFHGIIFPNRWHDVVLLRFNQEGKITIEDERSMLAIPLNFLRAVFIYNQTVDSVARPEDESTDKASIQQIKQGILSIFSYSITPKGSYDITYDENIEQQLDPDDQRMLAIILGGSIKDIMNLVKSSEGKVFIEDRAYVYEGIFHGARAEMGRKIYLRLNKSLIVDGKSVNLLKIKGSFLRMQRNRKMESYAGNVTYERFVADDGRINKDVNKPSPLGGQSYKDAEREYQTMIEMGRSGLSTDLPIAYGKYQDVRWGNDSESTGFIISGLGAEDIRLTTTTMIDGKSKIVYLSSKSESSPDIKELSNDLQLELPRRIGRLLRNYHDAGYFHRHPYLHNIGIVFSEKNGMELILRDLDTTVKSDMFDGNAVVEASYRFIDFFHLMTKLLGLDLNNGKMDYPGNAGLFIENFLNGYFYDLNPESELYKNIYQDIFRPEFVKNYVDFLDDNHLKRVFDIQTEVPYQNLARELLNISGKESIGKNSDSKNGLDHAEISLHPFEFDAAMLDVPLVVETENNISTWYLDKDKQQYVRYDSGSQQLSVKAGVHIMETDIMFDIQQSRGRSTIITQRLDGKFYQSIPYGTPIIKEIYFTKQRSLTIVVSNEANLNGLSLIGNVDGRIGFIHEDRWKDVKYSLDRQDKNMYQRLFPIVSKRDRVAQKTDIIAKKLMAIKPSQREPHERKTRVVNKGSTGKLGMYEARDESQVFIHYGDSTFILGVDSLGGIVFPQVDGLPENYLMLDEGFFILSGAPGLNDKPQWSFHQILKTVNPPIQLMIRVIMNENSYDLEIRNLVFSSGVEIDYESMDRAEIEDPVGGIDLNPQTINLQQQGSQMNISVPENYQELLNMNIEGLAPVIINITPIIHFPVLLGIHINEDETEFSTIQSPASPFKEPEKLSFLH